MITVYKYPLSLAVQQSLDLPEGHEILSAQDQNDRITLWIKHDTNKPKKLRKIFIVGTGHEFPESAHLDFIDTVQQGMFVWHVFAETVNIWPL